jgi:LEA14-like dessication related protein
MITRKQILAGAGVAVLVTGGILAYQFSRLMKYTLKIKGIEKLSASMSKLSFDAYLDFVNTSDLQIALAYQNYKVYLNGTLITTIDTKIPQVIYPKSTSVLKVSVDLSPADLLKKLGAASMTNILNIKQQNLKVVSKMGVKYLGFTIPISTTVEDRIVNWITPTPTTI